MVMVLLLHAASTAVMVVMAVVLVCITTFVQYEAAMVIPVYELVNEMV